MYPISVRHDTETLQVTCDGAGCTVFTGAWGLAQGQSEILTLRGLAAMHAMEASHTVHEHEVQDKTIVPRKVAL